MPARAVQLTPERGAREPVPARPEEGDPLLAGRRVGGRYRLERCISPRGNVWLAVDSKGHHFAVKSGHPELLRNELQLLGGLSHQHVVRLLDVIEEGPSPVLVLEYLAGGDLVSLAGLKWNHWIAAADQLIAVLSYLHDAGIAHRDLKARNVMFDAAGRVRLIDFGSAARIGSPWSRGGTTAAGVDPHRGEGPVSAADDCYALAALLFELLHGSLPGMAPAPSAWRPQPPALTGLVATGLACGPSALRPGLDRFASGIKSALEQNLT
jgi:serine/threonine protein kinase